VAVQQAQFTVELNPAYLDAEPGGAAVEAAVTIHHHGSDVRQYTIEVRNVEREWVTIPEPAVGLWPGSDRKVTFTFHPPKRDDVRPGRYPFKVAVRTTVKDGSGGAQRVLEEIADGELDVRGYAAFHVDMTPRHQTRKRNGAFKVLLFNDGNDDVQLALEAQDKEDACEFSFPKDDAPNVPRSTRPIEAALLVTPRRRRWVGENERHEFTVTARPVSARGEPQAVGGEYTYRPWVRSWGPFVRIAGWVLIALVVCLAFLAVRDMPFGFEFGRRLAIFRGMACGVIRSVPVVGGMLRCPSNIIPRESATCDLQFGFRQAAEVDPTLVGKCITGVGYDRFGNGLQYTDRGVLFWQKDSNTVYFFTGDSVFAFLEGRAQQLHGSPRR
jgi:hypothetical protein